MTLTNMEKRISSTEYRLGIYKDWTVQNPTFKTKYYTDSLRINLLLHQILTAMQKEQGILIPTNLISVFINQNILNLSFGYFQIESINPATDLLLSDDDLTKEKETMFDDSDALLYTLVLPILRQKMKQQITSKLTSIKIKQTIGKKVKLVKKTKKEKKFRVAKHMSAASLLLFYFYLHRKWYEFTLNQVFSALVYKPTKITAINYDREIISNCFSETTYHTIRSFQLMKEWYTKIGGNLVNIDKRLVYLHYSLAYKNFTPLVLHKLKQDLEENPYKQKQTMTMFYNLLLAYIEVQRHITGIKLSFKGAIGQHGRAKTLHFFAGRLYTFELMMPIEYSAININSIFGTIGLRWWLNILDLDKTPSKM